MSELPEIRILYSPLLHNALLKYASKEEWDKVPPKEEIYARVESYQKQWDALSQKILSGLREMTGLEFKQNVIDIYPIPPEMRAFSEPLVIGMHHDPDMTVDVITHELIHRLMVDNKSVEFQTCPLWGDIFGMELSRVARIHIAVHAIHKAIYLDVLKEPARLERDVKNCIKYNAVEYLAAWDYVDKHGYKEIIEQVKEAYKELAAS